ncbi:murein transglycosylase A [Erythrobacter sp. AP23]|uniref:murein transglycosylase A n=1 Tax=Erythrobacter sp. AP23 TaxID=499656 RepID=UPI00076C3D4D|nr:murein transglycosylase A [Erythrobacter sp. AP23]KWV95116.1 MltA [Erythrobacter sp. AP23]
MRKLMAIAAMLALAACVRMVPDTTPPQPAGPLPPGTVSSAAFAPISNGKSVGSLGLSPEDAGTALVSFIESCPSILNRDDASGLTFAEDWRPACEAAASWPVTDARRFFTSYFETARVGDGAAFATGYFEPEIRGSRRRAPGYDVPIYAVPPELTRAWPADMPESEREGRPPLGRYDDNGEFVLFYDRTEIELGALENRGLEIAWAADPVEFFFLQIQGSGLLRLPDGSLMRIGYAGQNGREYVGIGRVMRERGLIGEGTPYATSMQGIMAFIRDNPAEGRDIMRLNKSWVFFRELNTDGPLGSIGVPVRREASVAVDPNFVPYGAPVFLDMDSDVADGLWIAQDTGGAIKGANRFDTFWGNGADAREIAGSMSSRGSALVLLPRGTIERLEARR